jgi:hypothetical protein
MLLPPEERQQLAVTRAAPDLHTYHLRRVGIVPFEGHDIDPERSRTLQGAFLLELGRVAPFEIVRLDSKDLDELADSEPYRRGTYKPKTLLELARRFNLDGVLVGTVTQFNVYPPQVLGLELDLVSTETGMVIWAASLRLDAADRRVRQNLEMYSRAQERGSNWEGGVQLTLISPSMFARFAAHEVAAEL